MAGDERFERVLLNLIDEARRGDVFSDVADTLDATCVADLVGPLAAAVAVRVDWLSVNERRVDASLRSDVGEWRVVLLLDDKELVAELYVHQRPPVFAGVAGGRAVVVNGPSGAGKSSVMEAVLRLSATPWVMFDEPEIGDVAPGYKIWRDTAPTLGPGYFAAIAALAATGNQVIVSSGGFTFADISEAMAEVPTIYVGLDCPLPILLERERGREGRWAGLAEASLGVHAGWTYQLRIDSSHAAPDEIANQTLRAIAQLGTSDRGLPGSPSFKNELGRPEG